MTAIYRVLVLVLTLALPRNLGAEQPEKLDLTPREYKAAILSKIPPYIQWPDHALPASDKQIVIGILGKDPFDDLLEKLVKGRKIEGRDVVVKTIARAEEISQCQILFIPAESNDLWQEWRKGRDVSGLLTVGESKDFATKLGGVVGLSVEERKLEINLKNARKAGLQINSKLLRISRVIN